MIMNKTKSLLVAVLILIPMVNVAVAGDKEAAPRSGTSVNPIEARPMNNVAPAGILIGTQIKWQVIAAGGNLTGTSPNYRLGATAGQTAIGRSGTTNHNANAGFWQELLSIVVNCCVGRVGDANGSGGDMPTISDISVMIDAKFITGECISEGSGANIRCLGEADLNLSGGADPACTDITIGDISMLIDDLFITGEPPFVRNDCAP